MSGKESLEVSGESAEPGEVGARILLHAQSHQAIKGWDED